MKNHIRTNAYRTIKKSFGRFISLIVMSILGVLVFVGLLSTGPDMLNSLDAFLDNHNTYDIKIVSTMGLTDDDLDMLRNVSGVLNVLGNKEKDVLLEIEDKEIVLKVSSLLTDVNTLELISGKMPENDNEIVVEDNFLKKLDYKLNDKIVLNDENIINKEVIIVGSVRSSLYFSNTKVNQNRGMTTIGSGTVNYYSYVLESNFEQDYYTNIYITVAGSRELVTSKDEYKKLVNDTLDNILEIKGQQENSRYQKIYDEAYQEINDKENELNNELNKVKKELDKAKKELDKAKSTLNSTKKELDVVKSQLDSAKKELDKGELEFKNALMQNNIVNLDDSLNSVSDGISSLQKQLENIDIGSPMYLELSKQVEELMYQQELLNSLVKTRDEIELSKYKYENSLKEYNIGYQKYKSGLTIYNSNYNKYSNGLKEYNENKEKYEKEIADAYLELNSIDQPKWFIYDRSDDSTYVSYINQTNSIKNLATLFPAVFYGVAILVSLVSMNRMVEDDRSEIGTLKSLGFSNHDIRKKYLIFSLIATLVGAIIGTGIGITFIPRIIFSIYRLLFDVPIFVFSWNIEFILLGVLIAILCICGASILTANIILKEKPSILMRPKAPKSGKKVFLENIKFIWNKLKFSNKITIRNLFRYKKRVLVTILGISGCTALMLCGFGIKDSIVDITNMQYINTFKYEVTAYLDELEDNIIELVNSFDIIDYTVVETIFSTYEESNVTMVIINDKSDLDKIVYLEDTNGNQVNISDNEVIITDKLAKIYKINIGDKVTLLDGEHNEYTFIVGKIVKNYIGHYVYMNKETLSNLGYEYKGNVIYMNTNDLSESQKDEISNRLLSNENIISVVHTNVMVDSVQDMLNSLDKVVVILVTLSACLSFVVLYNLSNINIRERKREIATLKVLGFYDKEVDNYITKEMIILTIIGILLGLGIGMLLTNSVISTVEMENAHFIRHIKINSYIYAAVISILFTFIVNFVTHFTLKRIDMIESLKSVE